MEKLFSIHMRKKAVPGRVRPILAFLEDSPDCKDFPVIRIGDDDARCGAGGMHNLSAADINRHMARIADDVARLRVRQAVHRITLCAVSRIGMGQANT